MTRLLLATKTAEAPVSEFSGLTTLVEEMMVFNLDNISALGIPKK